ncbi:MAG TPA: site-specific integrase [Verrucomicrobiae bacterium]|nr:site-specific integrase [Verrucomicrobiae bacterium]
MARRRFQTGWIRVRGKNRPVFEGRWREDVIQPDGTIRRVPRSMVLGTVSELKTKRNAQRLLEPILARINSFDYRPSKFTTIERFADTWETQVLIHQKPSSVKAAKSHLRSHIRKQLGKVLLHEFTTQMQQAFVTLLAQKRVSRKTIQNVLGTLASMVKTAKAWGYSIQPIVTGELHLPADSVREPARFFTGEEAKNIITIAPQPYRAMFAIAGMAGLRVGEIVGLQKADLDFDTRRIFVRRSAWYGRVQTAKSPASQKPVAMSKDLVPLLEEYLETWRPNPEGFLFLNRNGRPYAANKVVEYGLWPVLDKLKIPRAGMHAFRHAHNSLLGHVGANPIVMKTQMRHSDARVTLDFYSHIIGDDQRAAVDKVGEILRPNEPKSGSDGEYIQ